jgi:predicted lipid-binding transport protein (Tim44 family)
MNRRRRTTLIVLAVLVLSLVCAGGALASAGGGSSGFGGGGGGEGGGGGGGGAGLYIVIQILIRIAILGHGLGALVLIGAAIIYLLFKRTMPGASRFWSAREDRGRAARKKSAKRERRVELAAAEAAEEDPEFAPDVVKAQAAALFKQIEHAWDAGDRVALGRLVGSDLMQEWTRRLDDLERRGWRNRVMPLEEPAVEYVGLERRGNGAQDRVTVRIEARIKDYVEDRTGRHIKRDGQFTETVRLREFWTLGKRDGRWALLSIEQGGEGAHALSDEIVATRYADEQSMRDESLVEGAVAEAVPDGTKVSELADLDFRGDARAAALDLSLADGRFAPDVLEVAARRAVAAWAEAVDGKDDRLYAIAHGDAVRQLLHPGDPSAQTRLVVRGLKLKKLTITGLDAGAEPPTMSIEVELEGRRYIEDRDTAAVVAGSKSRVTSFTEHWTLALDGDKAQPWRIAAAGAPAARS